MNNAKQGREEYVGWWSQMGAWTGWLFSPFQYMLSLDQAQTYRLSENLPKQWIHLDRSYCLLCPLFLQCTWKYIELTFLAGVNFFQKINCFHVRIAEIQSLTIKRDMLPSEIAYHFTFTANLKIDERYKLQRFNICASTKGNIILVTGLLILIFKHISYNWVIVYYTINSTITRDIHKLFWGSAETV